MKFVIGNIVSLKTRYLYKIIDSCNNWDTKINVTNYNDALEEIFFWKNNLDAFNVKKINGNDKPFHITVHSDASDNAVGVITDNGIRCHRNL